MAEKRPPFFNKVMDELKYVLKLRNGEELNKYDIYRCWTARDFIKIVIKSRVNNVFFGTI